MSKICVKVTAGGITLEATGEVHAVNAQVERFLAEVKGAPAGEHNQGSFYDAIVTVLHRAEHPLTRAEIEAALRSGGFKCPKNLPQALADTKRPDKGKEFITHARRGAWKLTAKGRKRAAELELEQQNSNKKG